MGRRAHAVHCTWRVAQNVQTSLLVHGKKIRLDFLHSAYITDDTLNQNYRRALPNSKNSDFPNISIGAHTLLGCEIAETSHDAVRTATSTSDGHRVRREVLRGVHQIQLGVWGALWAPQRGPGRSPGRFWNWRFSEAKNTCFLEFLIPVLSYKNPCYFLHT